MILWFGITDAMSLQGAASVSETQALTLARLSLELSLSPSLSSVTRECLPCLSSPLTASSVKGEMRVDGLLGLLGLGALLSASVATSSSHCSPLEKSTVRSSCPAWTGAVFCSSCL